MAGEAAQLVNACCISMKLWVWFSHPHISWVQYNFTSGMADRWLPGACWPASLAKPVSLRFSKNRVEKNWGRHLTVTSGLHTHAHTHVLAHTCTQGKESSMGAHTYNSSIQKVEAERAEIQSHPRLYSKFKSRLAKLRLNLQKKKKSNNKQETTKQQENKTKSNGPNKQIRKELNWIKVLHSPRTHV